jgi:hypothetical protein
MEVQLPTRVDARDRHGQSPTHRLVALPGVLGRTRRLLGPLNGLIDDG